MSMDLFENSSVLYVMILCNSVLLTVCLTFE